MSIRLVLVIAVLYFIPIAAGAAEQEDVTKQTSLANNDPELIEHQQSLAVHLGLTSADVVFGKPRNFRTESLNYHNLEPLIEAEEN